MKRVWNSNQCGPNSLTSEPATLAQRRAPTATRDRNLQPNKELGMQQEPQARGLTLGPTFGGVSLVFPTHSDKNLSPSFRQGPPRPAHLEKA